MVHCRSWTLRRLHVNTDPEVDRVSKGQRWLRSPIPRRVHEAHRPRRPAAGRRRPSSQHNGSTRSASPSGKKGEIVVDEFLRTTNANRYAAGDVIGDPMFVYVAAHGGALAAENALTGNARRYDLLALPKVTFTDPAAASVGLSEEQARADRIEPLVSKLPFDHVPRALVAHDTREFIKLVANADDGRNIGAHILAAEAEEMITELALAVKLGRSTTSRRLSIHT